MKKNPPFTKRMPVFVALLVALACIICPVAGDENTAGPPETLAPAEMVMNTTLPVETEAPPNPALNLSIVAEEKITATPTEQIRLLLMAAPKEVTHPCIWNVSMIEGDGNYTSLLEIPVDEIGDGDTIRIWGVADHPYNGGFVIDKPNVTVTRWEGSPAQPLITNTTGEAPAFTVTADNAIFRGLTISDNHLDGNGAGIYATRNFEDYILGLTITDCTFTGNTAESGGALYVGSVDKVLVEGTRFTGNRADYGGGGAWFGGCENVTLTDAAFTGNRAGWGGGAWFGGCESATLTGTSFTDNTATYYGGGALFVECDNATLSDTSFAGNTADDGGGAWFEECGNATLSDTSFTDNTAGDGGGASFEWCENATLTGTSFTDNTAGDGGGASFEWCENATLTDATFTDNTATSDGGGVEVYQCNDVTLTGNTFTGNTADDGGGADVWDCNDVTLTSNTFIGNTADDGGGTGFFECENVTLAGATFANNAATFGGGASFEWCENATLTGTSFTDNTVTDPGDGPVPQSSESSEDEFESSGGGIFLYESFGATITNCRFDNLDNIRAVRNQDEYSDIGESDFVDRFFAVLNTTRTPGTNIAGGPYLGGNLWLNDPEQNISEWGTDADFDGICDEPLTLYWNDGEEFGTDHLPLVYGGTVGVTSTPVGASVHLDGMTIGRTNDASIYLPVGDYSVTVTLDGYVTPAHRTVSVVPGETVSVAFALEPVSTSSSGSGGGHSDLAVGSAGDISAGGSGILTFQGPAIYEIRVEAGESIRTILVTIGRTGLPSSVEAPAGQVFEYDEVTLYHTTDDAIEGVYIFFKIPKEWLEKKGLDPADVVLYRYHDGAWQALATEVVEEDETFWHFSAWSQGFSLFAIGGDPTPVEVKVPDAGAEAGTTDPIPPVTPDKPTPAPTESTTPFPTTFLLICGAAVLIIAAVLLWKRR